MYAVFVFKGHDTVYSYQTPVLSQALVVFETQTEVVVRFGKPGTYRVTIETLVTAV